MKRKVLAVCTIAAMAMNLMACGAENANASTNVSTEKNTQKAATEQAVDNKESKEQSGSVTVYMPSPTDLNTAYVDGFEKKTGIKVDLFEGTTGEILARLETEKNNPVADVVVLASWSDGLSMKNSGQTLSYPEADNKDKLYKEWVDEDNMLFGTSASALGVIYNTTIIESLNADWSELSDEQYKDLLAIPDPEKSGSCKDFLAGYMCDTDNDWSAWEGMANNGMMIAGANKAALESVITGEKGILVAGVDYNAYTNMEKGEPLNIYYPESGTVINPRPAMILKSSQNVDNAKAFIDYLMSDEAQMMVADAYLLPGRSDITCDNRTNVSEITTFKNMDWNTMMKNSGEIASKLNKLCQ